MVKHNNKVPNEHFHKDWQRQVKLWLNQAGKKKSRRDRRHKKAAATAPKPLSLLRPIVRGQTKRYNGKVRAGRGFTLEEIRGAGLQPAQASTIGIAVDHRRVNKSEESLNANIQRLKSYTARLVVFNKKTQERPADFAQTDINNIFPIRQPTSKKSIKARVITAEERDPKRSEYVRYRRARADQRLAGVRVARATKREARLALLASAKGKKGKRK